MSYADCTAWITLFAEQATGVTPILLNILLPIKVAILWSTLCAIHCVKCFYFYWYGYETINYWFLETLRLISRCCEADFERWLINHLNSIDLSKSTPTPNRTGASYVWPRCLCNRLTDSHLFNSDGMTCWGIFAGFPELAFLHEQGSQGIELLDMFLRRSTSGGYYPWWF